MHKKGVAIEVSLVGQLTGVLITIGPVTVELSCLVVLISHYELILGCPSLKVVSATLYFDKELVTFRHASGVTEVPLITKRTHENASLTDQSTANEDSDGNGEGSDEEKDETERSSTEELVLTSTEDEYETAESSQEDVISSTLGHL